MLANSDAERCLAFVNCQLQEPFRKPAPGAPRKPVVTVSRQTGAGGLSFGDLLAELLQARSPKGSGPWMVFDKNLVETILQDHNLPERLARHMPEDHLSGVQDAVAELLGVHPLSWRLIQQATETLLRLAEMGNVILVGRGGNVITRHMPHAFHVRLVGSHEIRVQRVQELHSLPPRHAKEFVEREDEARKRYLKKYFKADIDDPLLYDVVLNTDRTPPELAARLIADTVLARAAALEEASVPA